VIYGMLGAVASPEDASMLVCRPKAPKTGVAPGNDQAGGRAGRCLDRNRLAGGERPLGETDGAILVLPEESSAELSVLASHGYRCDAAFAAAYRGLRGSA
jgi:hypothetical protein